VNLGNKQSRLKPIAISFLIVPIFLCACTEKDSPERAAFFAENLNCPPPAVEQFAPWGQSGSEHVCKINHGPFVAFEWGYVKIRGQYDNGKQVGVWRYYDKDGKVEKEIDYSSKQ
jgi:hypothetical protein